MNSCYDLIMTHVYDYHAIFSGYMSPEYAMRGQFSVKSDVFSFGVLVLEIVSGKKNTDFYQSNQADDLLSFVSIN